MTTTLELPQDEEASDQKKKKKGMYAGESPVDVQNDDRLIILCKRQSVKACGMSLKYV